MIDSDVILGKGVKIFNKSLVNLFGCRIGEGTFIGPFVEITRGVVIGKDCKIESHSFICSGVMIEDSVFVGHGVVFTNDLYPKTSRQVIPKKTLVKKGASIGSNATIVGGVIIGVHAIVGAGAVVSRDIADFSIASGDPARLRKQFANLDALTKYINSRQRTKVLR